MRKRAFGKGRALALMALILIALLLTGAMCWYSFIYRPAQERLGVQGGKREAAALKGSIHQMTEEEIQEALDHIIEEGMFRISIASHIIVTEDGMAQLQIENNPSNRYLMKVQIFLDETGEEIYGTDLIDPGYYIQEAELDRALAPGEYAATAIFTALYPDNGDIVGTAGANVVIRVFAGSTVPTPEPTSAPEGTPEKEAARR